MRGAPAVQRRGQRARVGQVDGLGADRVDDGVAEPALALLDGLDHEQPDRHAGAFDAQQLARDERLGDARKSHQDIAEVRGHSWGRHARRADMTEEGSAGVTRAAAARVGEGFVAGSGAARAGVAGRRDGDGA